MDTRGIRAALALAVHVFCALILGCSSRISEEHASPGKVARYGEIGLQLTLGTSVVIDHIDWTLTNPSPPAGFTSPRLGSFDVGAAVHGAFTGLITSVPPGSGYDLTLTAVSSDAKWLCSGHAQPAPFAVLGGQTALETLHLGCNNQEPRGGGVVVGGEANVCAVAEDFSAMPLSAPVGASISLQAVGSDPDMMPGPLTFAIELSSLQPSGAGSATLHDVDSVHGSAILRCEAHGAVSVTMHASDGDPACTPESVQLYVQCTDACLHTQCAAPSQCHLPGTCDHATGICGYPPGNEGDACDDGNPATLGDVCQSGVCAGFECLTASDCPGTDTLCRFRACNAGECAFGNAPAGTQRTSDQIAGDCNRLECDGNGSLGMVTDTLDVPDDGNACTNDLCVLGTPSHTNTAYGSACSENGGQICSGDGACITPTFRVVRVGNGSAALNVNAVATFVDEYAQSGGAPISSIALPTALSSPNRSLMLAGNDATSGGLSRSADGHYLVLAGYDAAAGTPPSTGITQTQAATFNRIVARIDASGNVDTSTRLTTAFNQAAVRGATTNDGTGFWVSGASIGAQTNGGVWFIPLGASGGTQLNATGTMRWLHAFAGQLYGSNGGGPNLATIGSGLPTSGSQPLTALPANFPSSGQSPYGFALVDANRNVAGLDTLYMADDTSGGIEKWTLDGAGSWSLSATSFTALDTGSASGFRGLAAIASGSSVTLIAGTSAGDRIVKFVDDGSSSSPVGSVIVTASANTAFRGIAFSPR